LAGVAVPGKAAVVADLSSTASRSGLRVRRGPSHPCLHGHQITRDDLRLGGIRNPSPADRIAVGRPSVFISTLPAMM